VEALLEAVTRSSAIQIFHTGVFNCDPHPGNLMVQALDAAAALNNLNNVNAANATNAVNTVNTQAQGLAQGPLQEGGREGAGGAGGVLLHRAVLLDFGLSKRLSDRIRLAFAKMVVSAAEFDIAALLEAYEEMGLKLTRESPAEDLAGVRYLLRLYNLLTPFIMPFNTYKQPINTCVVWPPRCVTYCETRRR